MKPQVICVPGSVAPAAERYAPLKAAVADRVGLHLKDLELYKGDAPPADYTIEIEVAAIDDLAERKGLDRFHLVGYSGGGMISLAYAGTRPDRLLSLAVFEPARIPGRLSPAEQAFFDHLSNRLAGLQGPEFMTVFVKEQVKPGAKLNPSPPPSPEMRKRPAGIAAMLRAFESFSFERDLLRKCAFPVYYSYGDLSHDEQALKAGILAQLFPDIHVRRFMGIHHFVPPEEIYVPQHVQELLDVWESASTGDAG